VHLEADARIAAILGARQIDVNSRHHQAVDAVGAGLRVSARASDGIIEAIENSEGAFCVGVQWHPETLESAHRRALFGAFVAACA
jgi:putative glutamine amidotransferase